MRYSYEAITDSAGARHFRVRDADDNRVATCFLEDNARLVVGALNVADGAAQEWTCGHKAGAACAECYRLLAAKAHELATRGDD